MKIRFIDFFLILIIYLAFCGSPLKAQLQIDAAQIYRETFFVEFNELDSIYSINTLIREIDNAIKKSNLNRSEYGIVVKSLKSGKQYYSINAKSLLTPASVTKLYTTFAAFEIFGEDYQIPTKIFTDGTIGPDSILKGNLYLVGFGDGMLSIRDLELISDKVKNLGIKGITGNIYVDGSYFDNINERLVYSGDKDVVIQLPPISSVILERNTVNVVVSSGAQAGKAVRVHYIPDSEHFITANNAIVSGSKRKSRGATEIDTANFKYEMLLEEKYIGDETPDTYLAATNQKGSGIRVLSRAGQNGKQVFTITGSLPQNRTVSYAHHLTNPELSISGTFKSRLEAGGIRISGESNAIRLYNTEALSKWTLLTEFKRPITDIINRINKDSDNFLAEVLFKKIGAEARISDNTALSTRMYYEEIFENNRIAFEKCKLNDGSGLSRRNLITPESVVQLLEAANKSSFKETFRSSFALAGNDGTLKKRMKNSNTEGNLTGKTGTLRNVSALAGYVDTIEGDTIAFAFIFNGPNVGIYKDLENKLAQILSEFTYRFAVTDIFE